MSLLFITLGYIHEYNMEIKKDNLSFNLEFVRCMKTIKMKNFGTKWPTCQSQNDNDIALDDHIN